MSTDDTTTIPSSPVALAMGDRLDGKTALVTGASGEAGRLVARALADRGAGVVLHAHSNAAGARQTAEAIQSAGGTADVVEGDLTSSADVERLVDQAIERHGALDVLVHTPGMVLKKPMAEITDDEFDAMLALNTTSTFYVMREAARKLADQGRIIVFSTSLTSVNTGFYSVYAGTKAPVEQFAKMLAFELGDRGITVNAIAPGPIDSTFFAGQETEESTEFFGTITPFGRLGVWPEIAPVIAFLASPDAHWVNGQTIRVNAGMTSLS